MANTYAYVDGDGNTHTYFEADSAGCQYLVVRNSERWQRGPSHFIEPTPNALANQYRDTTYKEATYEVTVLLNGTSTTDLETLKGNWSDWHDIELGEGYVKRITFSGTTRVLDCIPVENPFEPDGLSPVTATITQQYIAAMPWWRDESLTTAGGTLNGTTSVNVTCGNSGDVATFPLIVYSGSANKPRVTIGSDSYQVNATSVAGTTITVDMRPVGDNRMSVYKQTGGTGAKTYLTITSASKYLTLPRGTTGVSFDASSGTAGILVSYYQYYRDLY